MATKARGTFDVKLNPQPVADSASGLGRMSVDKVYHGDLDGTGKGEMLSYLTADSKSGVYVAVERVTGTLNGRRGSFVLHHTGVMNRGTPSLSVSVVPDSGTEQLTGITGTMSIIIEGKKHSYEFDYTLPEKK